MAFTYAVNGKGFQSFSSAVQEAKASGSEVFEIATGLRRWTPGTVSAKSVRQYKERLAAYNAQQSAK